MRPHWVPADSPLKVFESLCGVPANASAPKREVQLRLVALTSGEDALRRLESPAATCANSGSSVLFERTFGRCALGGAHLIAWGGRTKPFQVHREYRELVRKRVTVRGGEGGTAVQVAEDSRFDRRMAELLEHATDVFFERGYEGASMRDLSRASGMSLAGLYHYVDSKERLLYLIQRHTFATILERLHASLEGETDPVARLQIFIRNHLEYFLANMKAMKVLSHEDDVLKGEYGEQVQSIKREYYRICLDLVSKARASALQVQSLSGESSRRNGRGEDRTAVVILFGMMNWLYTWYNPRIDGGADELTEQMTAIFLHGLFHGSALKRKQQS